MNDPCRLELRGLSGSEPCGACNRPARDHRGHREYVEPTDPEDGITAFAWSCLADGCCPNTCTTCHPVEPEYWTVEYMIGNSDWISHGLGVYTTRAGAEEALKLCSIHVDSKRVARCDASSRIVSSSVAAVETFEPAKHSEPDSTTVTMSQDAYDAAIAGAKREGWSRAVLKLRDGHRFVQASDCLARTIPDAWPTPPNPLTKIASAMGCDENEAACLDAIDSLRRELSAAEDASSMERQRRKDAESARDAAEKEARELRGQRDQLRRTTEDRDCLYRKASSLGNELRRAEEELASVRSERDHLLTLLDERGAQSRVFPEALREQIEAWNELRSGCRSAYDLIRDVHAWLASQQVDETAALRADIREFQRNALPSNCTRCNGLGAEPPGCPESGPCERCGGWTSHKRLVAGEAESLRARVRGLEDERDEARAKAIEEALAAINNIGCAARVRDGAGDWIETIGRRETYLAIRALADRGAK